MNCLDGYVNISFSKKNLTVARFVLQLSDKLLIFCPIKL